ncbi:MAG: sulfotransferase [Pseudomonadota bacterium]
MRQPQAAGADSAPAEFRRAASRLISEGRLADAERLCAEFARARPALPDAHVFRVRAAQKRSDFHGGLAAAELAVATDPDRLDSQLVRAESFIYVGRIADAITELDAVRGKAKDDAGLQRQLSILYTQLGRHHAAYDCARAAQNLDPRSTNYRYLVASAAIAVGAMEEAERLLNDVLAVSLAEGDVYYNRATLRRQTPANNHVDELRRAASRTPAGDPREAPLSYALGKELEDLGDHAEAFECYERGAESRRARLRYRVEIDEAAMADIAAVFDAGWSQRTHEGGDAPGPIFVLGLPRSGTTLVERILSAHSAVASLGEVNDVAYAVVRAGYPAADKSDLMRKVANADMERLGREIRAAFSGYGENAQFLIDKTPANYLYLGLILKALPGAHVVHLRRHPLASCFAMYKTLFRMGYPFSYDLADLGRYYLAYAKLCEHWREVFPGRIHEVEYEALVDDQDGVSRALVAACGLDWEDACLEFHNSAAPTATASAAQVRRPLYTTSRDLWRVHEARLAPLTGILTKGGVL